jgi:radical SAM protein with 4Fe4S-binding SPASM domain
LDLDLSRNATPIGFDDIKNTAFYWCTGWTFTWSIDVYGNAYSCIYMREEKNILWNVLSESVLDIWRENNKRILERKPEKCLSCWFSKHCWWKCYLK